MPALSAWPGIASGAPLTVTGAFQILDTRTANSANIAVGMRHQFGAVSVVPNGAAGTTGTASRGAAIGLPVDFQPFDTLPNFFSNSVNAFSQHPSATGGWTLTFTNGPDTATVVTPSIAGATVLPFARNVSMQGSGLAPTFTWAFPATAALDAVGITIRDLGDLRGTGGLGGEGCEHHLQSDVRRKHAHIHAEPDRPRANDPGRVRPQLLT